jgi:uncharacterized tellurite resistance protein B-like protein
MENMLLKYDEAHRTSYLCTMATLAMADGEVDQEESDLLKQMCTASELSAASVEKVVKAMNSPEEVDLATEMQNLKDTELRFYLATDMLMLVNADGEITEDEQKQIAILQARLNLSEDQFATLGKYVDAVQTYKQEGVSEDFLEKVGLADDFQKYGIPVDAFSTGKTVGEVVSKIAVGALEKKLEGTKAGAILSVAKDIGLFNGLGK